MDVVGLKDPADIGLVGLARTQALDRRVLGPEFLKKGKWEFGRIECPFRERRNGFFNLNGVHSTLPKLLTSPTQSKSGACPTEASTASGCSAQA
jgi:hypothetical protein